MKKIMFRLTVGLLLVFSIFMPHQVLMSNGTSEDGDVEGVISVTGNNNVAVLEGDGFVLRDLSVSPSSIVNPGTLVFPKQSYQMSLDVSQLDGIDDFKKITFMFFNQNHPDLRESFNTYDATGIREKVEGYVNNPFILSDDAFIVEWTPNGGFERVGGESTSWFFHETSSEVTNVSSTRFKFNVDFDISKVAMQNNVWHIAALIEDGESSDVPTETFVFEGPYRMAFYGEVSVPQNAQVVWEGVLPGSSFFDNTALISASGGSISSGINVNFLANGFFQQRTQSSAQWEADVDVLPAREDNLAFLVTDPSIQVGDFGAQEFAILAGFAGEGENDNLVQLDTSLVTFRGHRLTQFNHVNPNEWRSRTPEEGRDFNNITFFLSIASDFQNARYEGLLTVGISNEIDLIQLTVSEINGLVSNLSTQGVIGVFAETEAELKALLESSHVDVPIYLKNGFLNIESANFEIDAVGDKKVIGDLFVTGFKADLSDFTIHFGQLHVLGNEVTLDNISIRSASPGGDLFVSGDDLKATNLRIDGDVRVLNATGSGLLDGVLVGSSLRSIGGHVYIENSTFTIRNYDVLGYDSIFDGNITVINSKVTLGDRVSFNRIEFTDSVGTFIPTLPQPPINPIRPLGNQMELTRSQVTWTNGNVGQVTLSEGSVFTKDRGDTDTILVQTESHLEFNNGTTDNWVELRNSTATFSGGAEVDNRVTPRSTLIGQTNWNRGIIVDRTWNASLSPSSIIVNTVSTSRLLMKHQATATFREEADTAVPSFIRDVAQLENEASLVLEDGIIANLRLYDETIVWMSGGEIRSTHAFNDSVLEVTDGKLGYNFGVIAMDQRLVLSDRAQLMMMGGAIDLDVVSSTNADAQLFEGSSSNRGFLIRDDAQATLGEDVTITSSSELELRDNASLTVNTSNKFNRAVRDLSAMLNEYDGEGSNINFSTGGQTEIFIYVRPDGGTNRTTRVNADSPTTIPFDFNLIEGTNSALEEARRLRDNVSASINTTIYLYPGEYTEEATIQLNVDNVSLMYVSSRANTRSTLGYSNFTSTSNMTRANLITNIVVSENINATIHGVHLNVENASPIKLNDQSAVLIRYSFIHQVGGTTPIIDSSASQIRLDRNYITRSLSGTEANTSVGILIDGAQGINNIIEFNRINNIASDAIVVQNSNVLSLTMVSNEFNDSSGSSRPIGGHAVYLRDNTLSGQLNFSRNIISQVSLDGLHVENVSFGSHLNIQDNQIINVRHGVYFNHQTTFSDAHEIRIRQLSFTGRNFSGAGSAVYFDGVLDIYNLVMTDLLFSGFMHALNIQGANTVQSLDVVRGSFSNFSDHAFNIHADTVNDVRFSHLNPSSNTLQTFGHNVNNSGSTPNLTLGSIDQVDKTAINIEAQSLDGFILHGFTITNFAKDGSAYAGVDFNVSSLKNLAINQTLYERNTFNSFTNSWVFNRYDAIQVTLRDGSGPALRFHLDDSYVFEDNKVFQPRIVDNTIGLEFTGTLSEGSPIETIFSQITSLVLAPSNGNLQQLLEILDDGYSWIGNTTVNGETEGIMTNNTFEIVDFAQPNQTLEEGQALLDYLISKRDHYNNFGYGATDVELLTVILVESSDGVIGLGLTQINYLSSSETLQKYAFTPQSQLEPIADLADFIQLESIGIGTYSLTIDSVGTTKDDGVTFLSKNASVFDLAPRDSNFAYFPLAISIPDSAENSSFEAIFTLEGIEGSAKEILLVPCAISSTCIDRDNSRWLFYIPVAIVTDAGFKTMPEDAIVRAVISWDNITQQAFIINYTNNTQTYFDALNAVEDATELESILLDELTSQVSTNIEGSFYNILFKNLELDASNSFNEFETLFDELIATETARQELFTFVHTITQSSINTPSAIETTFPTLLTRLLDVQNSLANASIVLSVEGEISDLANLETRLKALNLNTLSTLDDEVKIQVLVALENLHDTVQSLSIGEILTAIEGMNLSP